MGVRRKRTGATSSRSHAGEPAPRTDGELLTEGESGTPPSVPPMPAMPMGCISTPASAPAPGAEASAICMSGLDESCVWSPAASVSLFCSSGLKNWMALVRLSASACSSASSWSCAWIE